MRHRVSATGALLLWSLLGVACAAGGTSSSTSSSVGSLGSNYPVGHPDDVIASETGIWVLDSSEQGILYHFNPTSKAVVASIAVGLASGSRRENLAVSDSAVWVAYSAEGALMRIDPQNNQVVTTFHFAPGQLGPITASPTAVWAAETDANRVVHIDPTTGTIAATISLSSTPTSVAYGAGAVWVCGAHGGAAGLTRIDPQTNQVVAQIDVGDSQGYVCDWAQVQSGALWVVALDTHAQRHDLLVRIDPAMNRVLATIQLQGDIQPPIAIEGQDVWASANADVGTACSVVRVDAQATRIKGTLPANGCLGMLQSAGSLWLVDGPPGSLRAVTPAT
jgi:DNA-binding beta-propeller fold protein YncE